MIYALSMALHGLFKAIRKRRNYKKKVGAGLGFFLLESHSLDDAGKKNK